MGYQDRLKFEQHLVGQCGAREQALFAWLVSGEQCGEEEVPAGGGGSSHPSRRAPGGGLGCFGGLPRNGFVADLLSGEGFAAANE